MHLVLIFDSSSPSDQSSCGQLYNEVFGVQTIIHRLVKPKGIHAQPVAKAMPSLIKHPPCETSPLGINSGDKGSGAGGLDDPLMLPRIPVLDFVIPWLRVSVEGLEGLAVHRRHGTGNQAGELTGQKGPMDGMMPAEVTDVRDNYWRPASTHQTPVAEVCE